MAIPMAFVLQGAMNTMQSFAQQYDIAQQNKMAALTYETQAKLSLAQNTRQQRYINEQLSTNLWNTHERRNIAISQARAGVAASGFTDLSAGDMDLIYDINNQGSSVIYGLNRTAMLESFENGIRTQLEYINYMSQANQARINAKYASGWRGALKAFTAGTTSALGAYANYKLYEQANTPLKAQNTNNPVNVDPITGKVSGGYMTYADVQDSVQGKRSVLNPSGVMNNAPKYNSNYVQSLYGDTKSWINSFK